MFKQVTPAMKEALFGHSKSRGEFSKASLRINLSNLEYSWCSKTTKFKLNHQLITFATFLNCKKVRLPCFKVQFCIKIASNNKSQ